MLLTAWMQWCYKPTGDGCLCKKYGLGEEWKIDIPLSHSLFKCTDVQYANTSFRYCFTPLTRLSIHTADNSVLPLLSIRPLSVLSCCPIINICAYLQDMKLSWIWLWLFVHIQGFTTPNFLTICLMIVATLAIFQVWVGLGVYPGWSGTGRCCATCIQYRLASELFLSSIRKSSCNYSTQCCIIPLCHVLQKVTSVLVAVFIRECSRGIRNITSVPFL